MQSSFWSSTVWMGFIFLEIAWLSVTLGFLSGASGKESVCQCWRCRFNPWSGRHPGVGNGTPLQYSCLRNPMDSGTRWARVHGATKSWPRPAHPHTPPHTSITLLPVTVLWYPTSFAKSEIITEGHPCPPFPHLSVTRFPHMWYFLYYTLSGHPHKSQASRQPAMAAFAPRINSWAMGDNLGNIKNMVAAKMPQYFPLVIPI